MSEALRAVTETGRRDKSSGWRPLRIFNGGSTGRVVRGVGWRRDYRDAEVVCLDGVFSDVFRTHINETIRIPVNTDGFLQVFRSHANQLHITHRERAAALDADVSVETPATEQAVHDTSGAAEELPALTDRQFVDEVGLEAVSDVERGHSSSQVKISQRVWLIENSRTAREGVTERFTKRVVRLNQQTCGKPSANLDGGCIVETLSGVIDDKSTTALARVNQEVVNREKRARTGTAIVKRCA